LQKPYQRAVIKTALRHALLPHNSDAGLAIAALYPQNLIAVTVAPASRWFIQRIGGSVEHHVIEISQLVDARPLNRFHILVVSFCILILYVDGIDFAAANVAAPQIVKALGLDGGAMGLIFGAGNFGILLGTLVFGYIGDLRGRRIGAIGGVLAYSVPAIAVFWASNIDHLVVLRFLAGLGIGGVVPNVISLLNESAPKKFRATFVLLAFVGYSLGSVTSGQIGARIVPILGWNSIFVIAGAAGVVLVVVLSLLLPESVRYLTLREPSSQRTRSLVRRLAPDVAISDQASFTLQLPPRRSFAIGQLFAGDRRWVTPLLWIVYFAESLTYMTLLSWFTTLLVGAGASPIQASNGYSWGAVGGICLMLALARLVDRIGPLATAATAVMAIVGLFVMATAVISIDIRIAMAVVTYAFCQVTHNSLNATVGTFYSTDIRARAVAWATGWGRVALTIGPLVTGFLLAAKLPHATILHIMVGPYVVVICICLVLGLIYRSRSGLPGAGRALEPAPSLRPHPVR
jgi:MFS transporter, AAHS family, 4-hydroxybenzoate transporter